LLLPALIATACAAGSVPPVIQVNDKEAGVGVKIELCPDAINAAKKNGITRSFTSLSSSKSREF
jgi:hypothetical protein